MLCGCVFLFLFFLKKICVSEILRSQSSIGNSEGEVCHREPEDFEFVILKHKIVIKCFDFLKLSDWLALLSVLRHF